MLPPRKKEKKRLINFAETVITRRLQNLILSFYNYYSSKTRNINSEYKTQYAFTFACKLSRY